jgi:hypothetical protein
MSLAGELERTPPSSESGGRLEYPSLELLAQCLLSDVLGPKGPQVQELMVKCIRSGVFVRP